MVWKCKEKLSNLIGTEGNTEAVSCKMSKIQACEGMAKNMPGKIHKGKIKMHISKREIVILICKYDYLSIFLFQDNFTIMPMKYKINGRDGCNLNLNI